MAAVLKCVSSSSASVRRCSSERVINSSDPSLVRSRPLVAAPVAGALLAAQCTTALGTAILVTASVVVHGFGCVLIEASPVTDRPTASCDRLGRRHAGWEPAAVHDMPGTSERGYVHGGVQASTGSAKPPLHVRLDSPDGSRSN